MASPVSDRGCIAPETPDVVWFGGPDHRRFLNDLISQEISAMSVGDVRRSLLLRPDGKLAFVMWVLCGESRIGLMTDEGRGEALAEALTRYRIRVDVAVEPETASRWIVVGEGEGYDVSWSNTPRRLLVGDRPDLSTCSEERYERLRIGAGEPAWGVDVGEGAIPQESGLVDVSVDFDKGCFLGQELVARIDSRGGQAPRRLMSIDSDDDLLPGSPVMSGGEEVGAVTSAIGGHGLGMIKRGIVSGSSVTVAEQEAVVKDLPDKSRR